MRCSRPTRPVIFAYHGYPLLIHRLTYRRTNHHNIHVRGYKEEGTTTTPFDMVMLNDLDRFHLVIDVIDRVSGLGERAADLRQEMVDARLRQRAYTREPATTSPEVRDWTWPRHRVQRRQAGRPPRDGANPRRQRRLEQRQAEPDRRRTTNARRARAHAPRRARRSRRVLAGARWRTARAPTLSRTGSCMAENGSGTPSCSTTKSSRSCARLPSSRRCTSPSRWRRSMPSAALLPDLPAVACFDTAFHATLPAAAFTYALPARWRERWGLRKFGFHGLSHGWIARRTPAVLATEDLPPMIVSCHLGRRGVAVRDRAAAESIDTTMGFTPLDGLVMATRSGSVDPGLLLWLLERGAVAGRDGDRRSSTSRASTAWPPARTCATLLDARGRGRPPRGARDRRLRPPAASRGIAAMAASLGGLDALVFTGGVGEHAAEIRARAAPARLSGARDRRRGQRRASGDGEITGPGAAVRTLVLRAREDLEMARQARGALAR